MARALVTGATGLVGSHIVEQLAGSGWDVRAFVRGDSRVPDGVESARGDVLDRDSFAKAAAGCDVIFHTAAAITPSGGWEAYRRLNVDGTTNAIDAAKRSGARLLHVSSVAVYGPTGRYRAQFGKTDENAPLGPLPETAYYARSKRESEQLVLDAYARGDIWATAVRPDIIYGPRDRQFVPRAARILQYGFAPVIGGGRSTLAVVHAANVASGAILAATSDVAGGRTYNLANDFDLTVRDFLTLGGRGLGKTVHVINVPYALAKVAFKSIVGTAKLMTGGRFAVLSSATLATMTKDNPFTSDRAKQELGWTPHMRPEQGVVESFAWWREHARAQG